MPLVMFAGQSNALGFGNNGPAPYVPTWRVQIWTGTEFNYMNPGVNTGTATRGSPAMPMSVAGLWNWPHTQPNSFWLMGESNTSGRQVWSQNIAAIRADQLPGKPKDPVSKACLREGSSRDAAGPGGPPGPGSNDKKPPKGLSI